MVLLVVGVALVAAVLLVRRAVLDPATYRSALVEADAYERIYTDVLADPEFAAIKEQLLGDLGVPAELAVQGRTLGVNVLRWVAPPSTLQAASEAVIDGTLAYVRGDVPRLRADIVVSEIAARLPDTTAREVRTLLASAADRTVTSVGELERAVADVADQLAAGTVPAEIPKLGGATFDPVEVADAVLAALGDRVDDDTREMVVGAVLAGDQREAIIAAAGEAVAGHATAVGDRLRAEPTIDLVAVVAEHGEMPVARVIDTFDRVRSLARWFGPWTAVAGIVLALGGGALIVSARPRGGGVAWIGAALAGGGVLVGASWLVGTAIVGSPLDAATSGSWNLPPATRTLLADVGAIAGDRIAEVAWRVAAVHVLAGGAIVIAVVLRGRVRTPSRQTLALASGMAAALVLLGVVVSTAPEAERLCNGYAELCDRPYDDVTYAATHNAMSSPDVVPVWPEHDGGITEQLDAGVRALLIDTKHWEPLPSAGALAGLVEEGEPRLPPALASALYGTFAGLRDGKPGAFLCHIHCGFGAQPLVEGLGEVRDFLERNPHDVVTLIIQDGIPPGETAAAFDEAGLLDYVHPQRDGEAWPTLGELIERGERLVVFAEEEGPPPDWYANAFEAMQETPFLFLSPDAFSCAENRGNPDASLFQMNHWVQRIAPDRADSAVVNRLDVLVARARQCEAERGLRPNFLAVNFYNIGDVVAAAAVLNGVA